MKKKLQKALDLLETHLSPSLISSFEAIQQEIDKMSEDSMDEKSSHSWTEISSTLLELNAAAYLFCDGACRGNPGPGSWGSVGISKDQHVLFEDSGVEMLTTNNRMELMGAIRSLRCFLGTGGSVEDKVFLYTDSQYVVKGVEEWVIGWKNRGWKKADGKSPENLDLWKELDELRSSFLKLKLVWVKGHAGHPQNERCDQMANEALDQAGF